MKLSEFELGRLHCSIQTRGHSLCLNAILYCHPYFNHHSILFLCFNIINMVCIIVARLSMVCSRHIYLHTQTEQLYYNTITLVHALIIISRPPMPSISFIIITVTKNVFTTPTQSTLTHCTLIFSCGEPQDSSYLCCQ